MNNHDIINKTNNHSGQGDLQGEYDWTPLLTTGDVAKYCQVTVPAVLKWIKSGLLSSFTTPGGHHRISLRNFLDFMERTEMPIPPELRKQLKRAKSKTKVLVVDDDPAVRDMIAESLTGTSEDFEAALAADGFEAGRLLMRFKPDLVILDLMMPGMDGFEVCSRIKGDPETAHIKVLVVTGYPTEENIARAKQCGADRLLAKPFQILELRKEVARLLGK